MDLFEWRVLILNFVKFHIIVIRLVDLNVTPLWVVCAEQIIVTVGILFIRELLSVHSVKHVAHDLYIEVR